MHHDYWIGDRVWIAHLNCEGIFEGLDGEMARVKVKGRHELMVLTAITPMDEPEDDPTVDLDDYSSRQTGEFTGMGMDDTLDLHIDVLNPKLAHAEPAQILSHQRSRLKGYLEAAIDKRMRKVTVIHGKGDGVLRSEVLSIVSGYPEFDRTEEEGGGGAVVVFLNYGI